MWKRAILELYFTELYMIRALTHKCQKTTLLPANYVNFVKLHKLISPILKRRQTSSLSSK